MNKQFLPILILALVLGCAPARHTTAPAAPMTPPPVSDVPASENPGSLYADSSARYLFEDNRARRVGDIVIINVVDSSDATHKATTDTNKDSSLNLGVENLMAAATMGLVPFMNVGPSGGIGTTPLVKAGSVSEFKGEGETTRESEFSATVAARVVNVLSGDLLQVQGAREIRVNDETQILVVSGLVRTRDIGPDNTISSSYLADARIEFYGEGVVAEKQKPGWLTRILDNIWPF